MVSCVTTTTASSGVWVAAWIGSRLSGVFAGPLALFRCFGVGAAVVCPSGDDDEWWASSCWDPFAAHSLHISPSSLGFGIGVALPPVRVAGCLA
jgi:hypothetical protein